MVSERDGKAASPHIEANIIKLLVAGRDADKAKGMASAKLKGCFHDLQKARRTKSLGGLDNVTEYTLRRSQAKRDLEAAETRANQIWVQVGEISCLAKNNYPHLVDIALWKEEENKERGFVQIQRRALKILANVSKQTSADLQARAALASELAIDARRQLAQPRAEFLEASSALFDYGLAAVKAYAGATHRLNDALHDCGLKLIRARMSMKDLAHEFQLRNSDGIITHATTHAIDLVIGNLNQLANEVITQWRVLQREQPAVASVSRAATLLRPLPGFWIEKPGYFKG